MWGLHFQRLVGADMIKFTFMLLQLLVEFYSSLK
jgi:hypothetical protein